MSKTKAPEVTKAAKAPKANSRSLAKGLAAGLIGGLAGAIAMTFAERAFPARLRTQTGSESHEPEPPELAGEPSRALVPATTAAPTTIHWSLGALAGAAYGALAEFVPAATAREGATFGITLGTLVQEGAVPAIGVVARARNQTAPPSAAELTSHVVFGITTEWVRRVARKLL